MSGDAVTTFDYDAVGQITSITLPAGEVLTYEYDTARRLTAVENALGDRIEYTLDAAGNRLSDTIKDPLAVVQRTQTRVFDELSRLIEVIGANGQTIDFGYDLAGNLTSIVDGENNLTNQGFDALNRLISVTDARSNVASYVYDDRDNLVQVTDPAGVVTSYVYDGLDNLIQETSTASGVTTFQYDPAGNVTQKTDARGQVSNTTYDALNRPLQTTYVGAPAETITWTYDAVAGGNFGIGRLTGITDESGSTAFTYDHRGNVIDDTRVIDGLTFTTGYAYDLSDKLESMTYPSGRVVEYTRDLAGQLTSVDTRPTAGGTVQSVASGITWKPFGPIAGFTHGNGVVTIRSYDQDYRITQILAGSVMDRTYGYDGNNNITSITDGIHPARNQTFTYDDLLRLDSANGVYGSNTYGYDPVGNRLNRTIVDGGTTTETYTYQAGTHRLTNVAIDDGLTIVNRALGYTAAGATQTDSLGTKTYTWNARNRMAAANVSGTVTDYDYNALGQRVRKVGAENRRYHYDRGGRLIAQSDAAGSVVREYLWAEHMRFGQVEAGPALFFPHEDHLGSIAALSDGLGAAGDEWVGTPFGQEVPGFGSGAIDTRFPGQLLSTESELAYNLFRDYDPRLGRYVASDPIGVAGGYATYAYAKQNPVRRTDPTGLKPPPIVLDIDWQANIRRAQNAGPGFYHLIKGGGEWDYKQVDFDKYQDFGNYHFGVVARSMGLPRQMLLRGAGAYQIYQGTSHDSFGYPWWLYPYGDDPRDQYWIDQGIRDWDSGVFDPLLDHESFMQCPIESTAATGLEPSPGRILNLP